MKKIFIPILIISLSLLGCSQADTASPSATDIPPQPTASQGGEGQPASPKDTQTPLEPTAESSLVNGELGGYLPSPDVFQDKYSSTQFEVSNESLVNNWGSDFQQILDQVERSDGIGVLYDLESGATNAPPRILVVIERFGSIDGSSKFFTYEFPADFRKGIYNGESINLGVAENAILANTNNPNGDDPNALNITITFRYKNINAIVEGQGSVDNVTFEYLEPLALSILDKLEASH